MKLCGRKHEYDTNIFKRCPECVAMRKAMRAADLSAERLERNRLNEITNKNRILKQKYGITLDQYNEMLKNQGGRCAICRRKSKIKSKNNKIIDLAVDHCHKTGMVRGLLCSLCNTGIGGLRDSIKLCSNAVEYLLKHKKDQN